MSVSTTTFNHLLKCSYPFDITEINGHKVLYGYPTIENILEWLRSQHIYITALPFRDASEGPSLSYYYSVIDLNDFENDDDILCTEHDLGVSQVDYVTYQEAINMGIESYLSFRVKQVKVDVLEVSDILI